jgi:Protein of unknown function (DUF3807)
LSLFFCLILTALENNTEVNDILGYYVDGVKRTLSDEQVAIFRHNEIQELLRERGGELKRMLGQQIDLAIYTGAGSTAKAPLAESRDQSSAPSSVHEKEKFGRKRLKTTVGQC